MRHIGSMKNKAQTVKKNLVPFINLPQQHKGLKKELLAVLGETLDSAQFIMGPQTKALEKELAHVCKAKHALGVNSGTDALILALRALDIGPGDEVIVPDFTFVATATAVMLVGATPVLVDIDEASFHLDLDAVQKSITRKTKAIIPVHLYGQAADMNRLMAIARKNKVAVIEDAAQAIGAMYRKMPVGAIGHVGCLSFFPTKNLGALGDAGMVMTNNADLAKRLNRLRQHGADRKYYHDELGVNSRLAEVKAAALRVKLPLLRAWNKRRQSIAAAYAKAFAKLPIFTPQVVKGNTHVFHQYAIRTAKRDLLQHYLLEKGISTAVHYPLPLHQQPVLSNNVSARRKFPNSDQAAKEVLCLPIVPETTDQDVKQVITQVQAFFKC